MQKIFRKSSGYFFLLPDKSGNRYFGKLDQHVDVIRANIGLQDIDLVPLAKLSQHRSDFSLFPVKHCSSKFQSKHDVLKFHDVRTNALSFLKFIQNPFIVIQLADRISIVIKEIFFEESLPKVFLNHRLSNSFWFLQKSHSIFYYGILYNHHIHP